jgi:uncharacterized membrane protein
MEALFTGTAARTQFRRVVLVEFPRKGTYAIAFTTGAARGVTQSATAEWVINCFLPTTPNPTSGFFLLVPESELIETNLSVEDAFKLIMSAGLVSPESVGASGAASALAPSPASRPSESPGGS